MPKIIYAWFFDSSPWIKGGVAWRDSPGCRAEYALAHEWHIPCRDKVFELGRVRLRGADLRSGSTPRGQTA